MPYYLIMLGLVGLASLGLIGGTFPLIWVVARLQRKTMIALDTEQVESLEDLMRRRLELEYTEGHGERYLSIIGEVFKRVRPDIDFERERGEYLARMRKIHSLLGKV